MRKLCERENFLFCWLIVQYSSSSSRKSIHDNVHCTRTGLNMGKVPANQPASSSSRCDFSQLSMHQAFWGLNDVFYVCELCDAHIASDDVKMRVMLTEMCDRKCKTWNFKMWYFVEGRRRQWRYSDNDEHSPIYNHRFTTNQLKFN